MKLSTTFFKYCFVFILLIESFAANGQIIQFEEDFGELFVEVQMKSVFPDSKTFPDCIPKKSVREITALYNSNKGRPDFSLRNFVYSNFDVPASSSETYKNDASRSIGQHIEKLWDVLARKADDKEVVSSLIPLPYPYVVPGGRFREVYYWDSYFTMLGLQVSGRDDLIRGMVQNFAHLINTVGFIPNGNRSYYNTRSQPPFFSLMVKVLAEEEGDEVFTEFLEPMEKEYEFWMAGTENLTASQTAHRRVVKLVGGEIMNRYWDDSDKPRPESYKEDVELAESTERDASKLYRNLRAACESGWDFSSRWLRNSNDLGSIHTTEIIPVDLNSLLYHLEATLAKTYELQKNTEKAAFYNNAANNRKLAIQKYCWDASEGFYTDYDYLANWRKKSYSIAGVYPLFFEIASKQEAKLIAKKLKYSFLKPGGAVATLEKTGQQWDAPNGWPPLQWITIQGLMSYNKKSLAEDFKTAWIANNKRVYLNTQKMVEKYNVEDITLTAGGGEYDLQDGFGWSNGVLLKLLESMED